MLVLATKLSVPLKTARWIQRQRLVEQIAEGVKHPLTLISAPAGYGKTTLLSEWHTSAAGRDYALAWLSLSDEDNDPVRFFTYLIAALQTIHSTPSESALALLQSTPPPPLSTVLTALINDLVDVPAPFALVLDDYHLITTATIHTGLTFLLDHLPPHTHLIIATRADPVLPLARLRARNQLVEIRAADLRFTLDEAVVFFNQVMRLNLSIDVITALEQRTEGWIAGLQLAAFSMQHDADVSSFVAAFTGTDRFIIDYLMEEVLARQPESVQSFLLSTSILERLTGPLCDALTGDTNGQTMLQELEQANLFVSALDHERQWYRYHPLFADVLRHRLQQSRRDGVSDLHSRASAWLARHDSFDEAIQHALAGRDFEQAAALVEQVARTIMFTGRVNTLRSWLESLPATVFQSHPRLQVYRLWVDLLQGRSDFSDQGLQEKENLLRALPASPENDQLRVELMVLLSRFVALSGNTSRAIQFARESLAHLPEEDLASRARAYSALAIAYGLEGEVEKTEIAYRDCLRLAQSTGNYSLAAHTMMVWARGQSAYGQLQEAARTSQAIIDLGARSGQKIFFPAGQGYIGLADIHLEWNDLETAENCVKRGMELCSQGGLAGVGMGYILKSRLRQARGDLEGALEELRSLGQTIQEAGDPAGLGRQIQIRLMMGDVDQAVRLAAPLMGLLDNEVARTRLPLLGLEVIEIILVRVLLARGEIERATQVLDEVQSTAEAGRRFGHLIEVYLLRALALQEQNGGNVTAAALDYFQRALNLAEPEGYALLFVEAGSAALPLLKAVAADEVQRPGDQPRAIAPDRLRAYARRLLIDSSRYGKSGADPIAEATPTDTTTGHAAQELIEPLSKRELEILQLMCEGSSNQEIADRLVITLNTVKKHSSNIFTKLGVNSRTQAAARARELKLP